MKSNNHAQSFIASSDANKEARLLALRAAGASTGEIQSFLSAHPSPRLECSGCPTGRDCPLKHNCECGHMGANAQASGDRSTPDLYSTGYCPAQSDLARIFESIGAQS